MSEKQCNCHKHKGDENCNRGSMVNICKSGCGNGKDNKPNPKSATNNQWV